MKKNLSNEDLLALLAKHFENLDKSPVGFIGTLFRRLLAGEIDNADFCYYFFREMKNLKICYFNYPSEIIQELQDFWGNEFVFADSLNASLNEWSYGTEPKDIIEVFRGLLTDSDFLERLPGPISEEKAEKYQKKFLAQIEEATNTGE